MSTEELPVSEDLLKTEIETVLDSNDFNVTPTQLRSTLEDTFELPNGTLDKHREIISKLMTNYINANMKHTEMDDFDSYIEENNNKNMNNNKNKNKNKNKNHKNKKQNRNGDDIGIMDIDYSDSTNSSSYDILVDNDGISYSIMLNQTDINFGQRGHNKFYAIQLLEHKHRGLYKFIVKWGRVGNRAQHSEVVVDSKLTAMEKFKKKFSDKTKNEFGTKHFRPVKGKYIPIAIEDDDEESLQSDADEAGGGGEDDDNKIDEIPPSKLDDQLVRVLKLIFSRQLQLDTAKAMNFDLDRCPLGKLSQNQITRGYDVLCQITDMLLESRGGIINNEKLSKLSSKFYTIIPHNFGMRRPPNINNTKLLHKKIELIETLREMIFTNKILKKRSKRKNPIDVHYEALHCDIDLLDKFTMEYDFITKSIKGTHAPTHNRYEIELIDIFEINRHGSKFRHLPFRKAFCSDSLNGDDGLNNDGNCKLLWHGSRLSNFVGILSQGLRIAPPEAPTTGYMFGKGLYFADCSSKSANYIHATEQHPYGLLILSQVALGNMYPLKKAEYLDQPPNGYHSVHGIGKTVPKYTKNDDEQEFTAHIDDYELSLGPLIENENKDIIDNGQLLYNEYIVYDVAQVRMKYVALIKFLWK